MNYTITPQMLYGSTGVNGTPKSTIDNTLARTSTTVVAFRPPTQGDRYMALTGRDLVTASRPMAMPRLIVEPVAAPAAPPTLEPFALTPTHIYGSVPSAVDFGGRTPLGFRIPVVGDHYLASNAGRTIEYATANTGLPTTPRIILAELPATIAPTGADYWS